MPPAKGSPDPLTFRPGSGIEERLFAASERSGFGRSKIINAAIHDFLLKYQTPEEVIEAVKDYHVHQVTEKGGVR